MSRMLEISFEEKLFLINSAALANTPAGYCIIKQNGILVNAPMGSVTTIIFDTVAEVEALDSSYRLVYCKETNTFYEFDATSGETVDSEFILNTSAGGSTRWVGVSGEFTRILTNFFDGIQFGLTPINTTPAEGKLLWQPDEGTLGLGLPGGNVIGQLLQELHLPKRAKNTEALAITNGAAVRVSGATGSNIEVNYVNNLEELAIETIAVATENIASNQKGYCTTFGAVRNFDTSMLLEGKPFYLNTTDGTYTSTEPTNPSLVICMGICTRSHATQGEVFVSIHVKDHIRGYQITKEPTGFANPELVVVTGDSSTRKVTLTGTVEAYYQNKRITSLVSGYISPAHDNNIAKQYFLVYDGSAIRWLDLTTESLDFAYIQIAVAFYDTDNATWVYLREPHGMMQWQNHRADHINIGTYRTSGGTLADYVYNSTTAANRRPSISATQLFDEDLPSLLATLVAGGPYTRASLTGSNGAVSFAVSQADIAYLSGNQPYYNQWNGSSWVQTLVPDGAYTTLWVRAIPTADDATSQRYRFVFVQGQSQGTEAQMQALNAVDVNLGTLSNFTPEGVFIAKVILRFDAGNWTITEITNLTGTRANQTSSPSGLFLSSVTTDASLTGIGTASSPLSVDSSKIYRLYQPDGTNPFVYTDNSGTLHVDGNIVQNGTTYETHAEQLYTKKDYIITRDGAIAGLGPTERTGFLFQLYDGVNAGELSVGSDGMAKVGDVGNLQTIATREDTPNSFAVPYWNASTFRFETEASFKYDPATNALLIDIINEVTSDAGVTIDGVLIKDGAIAKSVVGLGNVTDDAQLKRADGDFNSFTEDTDVLADDIFLFEDSSASFVKKKVKTKYIGARVVVGENLLDNSNFINCSTNGYGSSTPDGNKDYFWSSPNALSVQGGFPTFTKQQLINLGVTDAEIEALYNLKEVSGNALDLSTNNYALTDNGTVTSSISAPMELCRVYNGSNQFHTGVATNAHLTTSQTWFALIKPTSATSGNIAGFCESNTTNLKLFGIANSHLRFALEGLSTYILDSDVILEAGKWYFCAGKYDATAGTLSVYVNGVKKEVSVTGTVNTGTSKNLSIGRVGDYNANLYNGAIQNFGILSVALTDAQIKALWYETLYKGLKTRRDTGISPLDGTEYIDLSPQDVMRLRGKTLTLCADVYSLIAGTSFIQIVDLPNLSGTTTESTVINSYERLSVTHTVSANATTIRIVIGTTTSNTSSWFENLMLVEGTTKVNFWNASQNDWQRFPRLMRMDPPATYNAYSYEEGRWYNFTPIITCGGSMTISGTFTDRMRYKFQNKELDMLFSLSSITLGGTAYSEIYITSPILSDDFGARYQLGRLYNNNQNSPCFVASFNSEKLVVYNSTISNFTASGNNNIIDFYIKARIT